MKRLGLVVAIAATSLALAACNANPSSTGSSPAGTSGPAAKGGTLTILTSATTVELDPAKSQSLAITSLGLVERRLTTWDIEPGKPATVVPDLATTTGTASDGGKTWTYTLKDGLKFSDGSPITSADVKYGVERTFAAELSGGLGYHKGLLVGGDTYKGPYTGKELASIQTPDAKTIVFHLESAYGDWPWIVSMGPFAPVPKAKDTKPAEYGKNPVASGPYEVKSYKEGTSLVLDRNPNWGQDSVRTAGPNSIVFSLGQDNSVSAKRLIADSGDDKNAFGATFVPPAQLAEIQGNPTAKQRLVTSDPGALAYLAINTTRGPLKNLKVRQAINYAVDKKSYLLASGGDISGGLATTLITPGIPGRVDYDLYKADPTGDVAKAKSLLQEAGYADKLKLTLLVQNDPTSLGQAQAIQEGLKRAGITVTLKPEDATQWSTDATGDKVSFDLTLSSWQPDFPSANGNIQPLFDSSQIGGGAYNLSRYSNPAVDKLIAQATAETDQTKSQALWAQADKKIMGDSPIVPLIYTRNSVLHGSNVANFFVAAFPAYPNYLKVSLKQ
jgi:ABC-type dipeptide transport system, periplasmic component